MIRPVAACGEPSHWFVCFSREPSRWWVNLLAWGEFKHVRAFAAVPNMGLWVFFDVNLTGTPIVVARDDTDECLSLIMGWKRDSEVLHVKRESAGGVPRWPVFSCTVAVRHLIGARSGALRPTRLFRDLLANGAKVIDGKQARAETGPADARSPA